MSGGDGIKLKSSGFASYIPPGRRVTGLETRIQNTERDSADEKIAITKSIEATPASTTKGKSLLTGQETIAVKSTKKLCRGIPREYIPPSRRATNLDGQLHDDSKIKEILPSSHENVTNKVPIQENARVGMKSISLIDEKGVKPTKKTCSEMPRENYVPPARRALIAEELRLAVEAETLGINKPAKIINKKCDGFVLTPAIQHFTEENNIQDEYSVKKCSFVVRGLPPELPDYSKDRYMKPYSDRGAIIRWLSPIEAILVFPTETIAKSALVIKKNSLLQIVALEDLEALESDSYLGLSTEIYNSIKPERDCRAANRMISAALGIALPKRQPPRAKSPKKLDAWDD